MDLAQVLLFKELKLCATWSAVTGVRTRLLFHLLNTNRRHDGESCQGYLNVRLHKMFLKLHITRYRELSKHSRKSIMTSLFLNYTVISFMVQMGSLFHYQSHGWLVSQMTRIKELKLHNLLKIIHSSYFWVLNNEVKWGMNLVIYIFHSSIANMLLRIAIRNLKQKTYTQALTLSNLDHWPRGPVDLRSDWPRGQ